MMCAMSEVKPIKAAVIGLGRAGWDIHVQRMRGRPEFQITAVADFEEARRNEARAEFGCDAYADYQSLLKSANAEVIVVASQSSTHAEITIAALKSGRHVIVEKPMAANLKDAKRMVAAAKASRKKLFVHQNYRFLSDVRHILEVIRSGEPIGRVFEVRMRALYFARRNDWQTLKKFGGGLLNNHGAHFIDTALQLLESPVKDLWADLKLITDAGNTEDHVKLLLRGKNGRVIDIEICTSCAFPETKWTLLGSNGTLVSDGKTSKVKRFDPAKVQPLKVVESPPENRRYGNDDKLPWEEYEMPSVGKDTGDYYDNVVDVLRRGGKQIVTPQQVLDVMTVIERAKKGTKFA
jgi:predicted dehydrogenase